MVQSAGVNDNPIRNGSMLKLHNSLTFNIYKLLDKLRRKESGRGNITMISSKIQITLDKDNIFVGKPSGY